LSYPLSGGLLALTIALSAACFVKAFGISFLALPRSAPAAEAREVPRLMLAPQVLLAALCVGLGLFPGAALRALNPVLLSLPGLQSVAALARTPTGIASPIRSFDYLVPAVFGFALVAAGLLGSAFAWRRRLAIRSVPTWGCGGELSARTEYTATAFSKPLMMIFRAIYRPMREVESLGEVSPYFPSEVRYRAEIEPTFERYVYGPLVGSVLRIAKGMKVLQAGSLHAYLGYVLVLGVLLLLWLGGGA
jgi:hydrogenase-4 component B